MKVYKLEVLVNDMDVTSLTEAIDIINETRYPNHTYVRVVSGAEAEIGEWEEDHPLNFAVASEEFLNCYNKLFKDPLICCGNCTHSIGGRWDVVNLVCLKCVKFSNWSMKNIKIIAK